MKRYEIYRNRMQLTQKEADRGDWCRFADHEADVAGKLQGLQSQLAASQADVIALREANKQAQRVILANEQAALASQAEARRLREAVISLRPCLETLRRCSRELFHLRAFRTSGDIDKAAGKVESCLAALAPPQPKEAPYYVRSFWSPCRKYIVTACVPSPGSEICIVDDNGDQWEPTGPVEDMTEFANRALSRKNEAAQPQAEQKDDHVYSTHGFDGKGEDCPGCKESGNG